MVLGTAARIKETPVVAMPDSFYHEVAYVRRIEAENKRLRAVDGENERLRAEIDRMVQERRGGGWKSIPRDTPRDEQQHAEIERLREVLKTQRAAIERLREALKASLMLLEVASRLKTWPKDLRPDLRQAIRAARVALGTKK